VAIRKSFASWALRVFPPALLLTYRRYVYFNGHSLQRTIPDFRVFLAPAILVLLEQLFRYEKAVSEKRVAIRDIVSAAVNVLFTVTVATDDASCERSLQHESFDRLIPHSVVLRNAVVKNEAVGDERAEVPIRTCT
jgi:hypothetical protein